VVRDRELFPAAGWPGWDPPGIEVEMVVKAKSAKKDRDEKLVEAARGGDAAAFSRLVETYQARVFAYMSVRLANSSAASQMVTDVFRRMYSDLQNAEEFGGFEDELFRLVELKLRRVRGRSDSGWTEVCFALEKKDGRLPFLKESLRKRLGDSVAGLDMAERQALDLRYGSGLSLAQVSKRLKRSEDAVKGVLAGAVGAVKKAVGNFATAKKKAAPGKKTPAAKTRGRREKNG
jgi:RNA polymerase sigma-70 factor (ECF subfamily)